MLKLSAGCVVRVGLACQTPSPRQRQSVDADHSVQRKTSRCHLPNAMSSPLIVTFVVAVNSRDVLRQNLLASPCLRGSHAHQVILLEGFTSAAQAYNSALNDCVNDIVVFVHQDVYLPGAWLLDLSASLNLLAKSDPEWGVLGCWGHTQQGRGFGFVYTNGHGVDGEPFERPMPVQTLDEIVLIIRRSSNLRFDGDLPDFHFYGTDLCLAAASKGKKCYAISAFCIHNARWYHSYPEAFYRCYRHIKNSWREYLPIQTSCIRISRFNKDYYKRRLRQAYRLLVGQDVDRGERARDPQDIMKLVESMTPIHDSPSKQSSRNRAMSCCETK